MPDDIERVFTSNGLSLFPFTLADVNSKCSCPDPKNPCKHIAAVYYQLGDFFREDPFVLFQLRGRTKEQILEALRQHRQRAINPEDVTVETDVEDTGKSTKESSTTIQSAKTKSVTKTKEKASLTTRPNQPTIQIENFWQYNEPLDPSLIVITPSEQTVLEVIGDMPLAATEAQAISAHLKALYQTVAQQAMMTALS